MSSTALAERPTCPATPAHGYLALRDPPGGWTPEQRWCGTWYDCTRCTSGVLYPSRALREQLAAQAARHRAGCPGCPGPAHRQDPWP
jgi:hypothetical protein